MSDELNRDLYRQLTEELEFVRSERVALGTLVGQLRNDLTAVTLERDHLRKGIDALHATWQKLLEKGL